MAVWYCDSVKHAAIAQWTANTAYSVGDIVRQLAAPTVGNERAFRCTTAGTSHLTTEPTWTITKAGTTNDNTVVWTEATGNSSWGWTAAAARLRLFANGASSWAAAGDTVYVGHQHAATEAAAITYAFPGTAASPVIILCVNNGATPPTTVAASASETISVTGTITFQDFAYIEGIIFNAGDGADNGNITIGESATSYLRFVNCAFRLGGTSASSRISIGVNSTAVPDNGTEWDNCTVQFASTSQGLYIRHPFLWRNTPSAVTGATIPSHLVLTSLSAGPWGETILEGVDLSALNTNFLDSGTGGFNTFLLVNCKLHASMTFMNGAPAGQGGQVVRAINCSSGDTNYSYHKRDYRGTITDETTVVRTGGASDGTTAFSRKMVSTANAKEVLPLKAEALPRWNETTGSAVTVTVEVITDGVTLTDAEAWLEVEYLGTSGFPLSVLVDDARADLLATAANQTSSVVAWTTTGLASPTKQKLSVSFTPQEKGFIKAKVLLGKASTTMYFCPKVDVS